MTKKHYIAIAKVLAGVYNKRFHSTFEKVILHEITDGLCEIFKAENPLFNKAKFIKAAFPKID